MKKMIASSFLDTLVNQDESIPYSTVGLIDILRRNKIKFTIITRKSFHFISEYNESFNFIDYIISSNGAYVYDLVHKKEIYKKNLLITNVRKIISSFKNNSIIYAISDKMHLLSDKNDYDTCYDVIKEDDYKDFLNNNKNNIYQIELHFKRLKDANKALEELENMNLKISTNLVKLEDKYIIDIVHQDIDIVYSFKKVLSNEREEFKDVVFFTTENKCISLLKKVGVGVALENASSEVKKVASAITLDNNHKGVEVYLEKYFKEVIN